MTKPIMLSGWLREYALRHELWPHTREQVQIVVRQFEKFTNGKSLAEITVDHLNRWTVSLLARLERPRADAASTAPVKSRALADGERVGQRARE